MPGAMAQAIGAQAAFPEPQVILLSGDGGFAMLMGDLLGLDQPLLPPQAGVFNNGSLGFVELEQKSAGFLNTSTVLRNPSFAAMAETADVRGIRLDDPSEVVSAAFAHDEPVLIDAVVNRPELAVPRRSPQK
jgi:pyruvate dehydrogenase (quinone)